MLSTTNHTSSVLTFFIVVLLYGAFLRLYPIASAPYWMDEGYTINAVLSYADGHRAGLAAVLDSGQPYECLLYCYPTALITNSFGENPFNYRILAVVSGLVSIGVIYLMTRSLFPLRVTLLTTVLMTFGYFQIAWSTQARWYTLFLALFWLAVYFLIKTLKTTPDQIAPRLLYGTATVVCTSLTILAHKIGIILPFIMLATATYYLYTKSTYTRKLLITLATAGLIAIASVIYVVLFPSTTLSFIQKINFNYSLPYYLSFLLREYWALIPFIIYAAVTGGRRVQWLLLIFLAYLIPLGFLTDIVHYRYLFHVTPVLFILAAVGLFRLSDLLPATTKHRALIATLAFLILFFGSGGGVLVPQSHYWLEADDPTTLGPRPSYAYTPQPDWNAAYEYIKTNRTADDITISSHPHFNKIFLREPGYWISFSYLGLDGRNEYRTPDNREFYVGASILDTLDELKQRTATNHGFIIYDYMAADGRISPDILDYIESTYPVVFEKRDNSYSHVWVYKF